MSNRHHIKDDRWHVLNRPGVYIGSIVQAYYDEYILQNGLMEIKSCLYVPALIKIINEVIDNCCDILKDVKKVRVLILLLIQQKIK